MRSFRNASVGARVPPALICLYDQTPCSAHKVDGIAGQWILLGKDQSDLVGFVKDFQSVAIQSKHLPIYQCPSYMNQPVP